MGTYLISKNLTVGLVIKKYISEKKIYWDLKYNWDSFLFSLKHYVSQAIVKHKLLFNNKY